ncbi:hypothetical protein HT136_19450 [Novosphingobium profundi]|nr:hypothetical protein [Novosphingobium profundi]
MKRIGIGVALLLIGLPVGAGGAYAALRFFPDLFEGKLKHAAASGYVPVDTLLVPLVSRDGRLAGYVTIDSQLEVAADSVADVQARLPFFLNAVNMRAYRRPLAAGPDGQLPDLVALRALLVDAAVEVYGKGTVRKAMIARVGPV